MLSIFFLFLRENCEIPVWDMFETIWLLGEITYVSFDFGINNLVVVCTFMAILLLLLLFTRSVINFVNTCLADFTK